MRHAGAHSALFEAQLMHETLRNERVRATMLASVVAVLGLTLFLLSRLDTSEFLTLLRQTGADSPMLALLGGLVVYELVLRYMLGRFLRSHRRAPRPLRYVNAVLEMTVPTLAILLLAQHIEPIYALVSVASYGYFLYIVLSTLRLEFWLCVFTGGIAAIEYIALAWYFLAQASGAPLHPMLRTHAYYGVKGFMMLLAGLAAGFVAVQVKQRIIRALETLEERNTVIQLFGQHVAPAVVEELLHHPEETRTTRKDVCVMFVDIRGFTQFAERRAPEDTVAYLNTLFEFMIASVTRHHGIVHQLLGDGFMAIFGAPLSFGNDAANAVHASLEIVERVQREVETQAIPPTRLGIGLHAGEVLAGPVGSAVHKEYKVTGDVVNLASRIEQLNKEFNTQLLISETVWQAVREQWPHAASLGRVPIRGHEDTVELFALAT
jgi:adenylate cyclase